MSTAEQLYSKTVALQKQEELTKQVRKKWKEIVAHKNEVIAAKDRERSEMSNELARKNAEVEASHATINKLSEERATLRLMSDALDEQP